MCLIVVKPAGVPLTEHFFNIVRAGAIGNDHGSGYMFKKDKSNLIHLSKGFFPSTIPGMIADIKNSGIGGDDFLVVHNRWATSGLKNTANCHPFVVTDDDVMLSADSFVGSIPCIAHNGVFGEFSYLSKEHSDTYMFVKTFLARNKVLNYRKAIKWLGEKVGWNKLAILHPTFGLCMVGKFEKDQGYYVSNKGYEYCLKRLERTKEDDEFENEWNKLGMCGL